MSFGGFPTSDFEVISPQGEMRGVAKGIFGGSEITVFDDQLVVAAGDELRRTLPNGQDETFEVVDPQFFGEFCGIPANYQIKVRRKGTFPRHTGGNFNVNISGSNARVNIDSTDNSTNIVGDSAVFNDLRGAIRSGVGDDTERDKLISAVNDMDRQHGGGGFLAAYQKFMALAADHMGVVGPFLPALAGLLG
jgi:hypothetical protein